MDNTSQLGLKMRRKKELLTVGNQLYITQNRTK
jgi:hypothetical protein